MSKKATPAAKTNTLRKICGHNGITEYELTGNGLRILLYPMAKTGIITSNITYFAGSRNEAVGESGVAHMLEHMLFKPTKADRRRKQDAAATVFEREVGCVLNANTWRDRTNYFFSYPKEHLRRALVIEAERMRGVVLEETTFRPEQGNVLSEFDMYNGDPEFALAVDMSAAAFQSHPYGHETIGFRPDIAAYTPEKLQRFYDQFYRPNNAVLTIAGDFSVQEVKKMIVEVFGPLTRGEKVTEETIVEPPQEGRRLVTIARPTSTNILAIGFKHAAFPGKEWLTTQTLLSILADSPDGVLHKTLVDTGLASNVSFVVEPTRDPNLGMIFVTLTTSMTHAEACEKALELIRSVETDDIKRGLKKAVAQTVREELQQRSTSVGVVAELAEYVSAKNWPAFFETETTLKQLTPKMITAMADQLFIDSNLTIGYFIGTNK